MGTLDDVRWCYNCGDYFVIDNDYGIHYCEPPKKRRFWMPKKKTETEPKLVGNGHTTINNIINEDTVSDMLRLTKIIAPDTTDKNPPQIKRELFGVRADAIDLVEAATYDCEYSFNQYEAEYQAQPRSIYDYGFRRTSFWWIPQSTAPCVKITLAGGAEYLIEGTLEEILELIDQAS